jgi:hypothetical protein
VYASTVDEWLRGFGYGLAEASGICVGERSDSRLPRDISENLTILGD